MEPKQWLQGVHRVFEERRAVVGATAHAHEAERLEHAQGLAHRGARDLEAGGELSLGWETVACGEVVRGDRLLELEEDLLECAPARDGLRSYRDLAHLGSRATKLIQRSPFLDGYWSDLLTFWAVD